MLKFITSIFSREVLGSKSVSLAFVALVFAVLIASVAYFIFAFTGGVAGKDGQKISFGAISVLLQAVIFCVFLFSFILIWFLLYVQYNREAEDIYSRLREKLVGKWQVKYELYPGQNRHDPYDRPSTVICEIAVNEATKKLEILFEMNKHPFFEDGKQVIETIALRHEVENKYFMSYYYKIKRGFNPIISQHLLQDDGETPLTELEIEIFATATFEDLRSKDGVKEISGEWFDLNGNLIRLFSLVSELREHHDDEKIFKKRLSDAIISRANFKASMGAIEFIR